ncbi:MAG: hypothetical protein E7063_03085 [Spirochaetaceae bacterium]|nr:hypothetical protein [Spirochaetaceae bacterium]
MQLCFDFGAEKPKNFEEAKKEDLPYWDNPKTDSQKLLTWQYEYVIKGEERALTRMYNLGLEISMKFINKFAQKNQHIKALSLEEKKEKAHNAISYVLVRYRTTPGWAIKKNFPGYLYYRVLYELYGVKEIEKNTVYIEDMVREIGGLEEFENCYIRERQNIWL